MREIRDFVKLPSQIIFAMVNGLESQSQRLDFEVQMHTYGYYSEEENMCFGCAAICAIQEITGINLNKNDFPGKHLALGFSAADLQLFESTLDDLRSDGYYEGLFSYLGIDLPAKLPVPVLDRLETHNWREKIGAYEAFASELLKMGF